MIPLSLRDAALALASGVAALLALRYLRAFPWSLAAIGGLGVGVLAIAALRTLRRLLPLFRRDD